MQCLNHITIRNRADGTFLTVPCSQCLQCRVNRRDHFVTRIYLESQSNTIGQFWTLTFSDEGLTTLQEKGARKLYKNFLDALRKKETRKGNILPIRSFGVLEHGSKFGRPHIHLIIWNHLNSILQEETYREGLPRPQYTIGQWPHGHIDAAPLNRNCMTYVSKYVTKFNDPTDDLPEPIVFHPRKPPLGYIGLKQHVERISKSPTRKWEQPNSILIDGKPYHFDLHTQRLYWWLCRKHNLKYERHDWTYADKVLDRLERMDKDLQVQERELTKLHTKQFLYEESKRLSSLREYRAYQAAFKITSRVQ